MSSENILEVKRLSFTYPSAKTKSIDDLNFEIAKGEFVLLCGSSGSGKTTLAKTLNGIIPHLADGRMEGEVIINGLNTQAVEMHEISRQIGMVFQNPEDQIFSIRVDDEVAFGVECQGYARKDIVERVNYALKKLRIEDIKRHITFALSGGQKQKVSIASNLAMLPSVIILDDPTTDLDPISKQEVMDILVELKEEVDTTFIVIEHDLTDLTQYADRIIVMHEGRIVLNGRPAEIFYENYDYLDSIGVRIPDHIRLGKFLLDHDLTQKDRYPVAKESVRQLCAHALDGKTVQFPKIRYRDYTIPSDETVARISHVDFTYPGADKQILFDVNLDIFQGEFLAIVGHNGSGKSTLMKNILGLLTPTSGEVIINGNNTKETDISDLILDIGYVFQNPDNQLFCNTVREEIEFGLRNRDFEEEVIQEETDRALKIVGLEARENEHPFSLSRGQRQRLAVATMLVSHPKVIMLDEPTTGLDEKNLAGLLDLMEEIVYKHKGTLIMVTHDMEVVAKYATRVVVVNKGEIILNGDPDDIFNHHYHELEDLKLKPTIISSMTSELGVHGMPYIPNWDFFQEQIIDAGEEK